MPRFSRRARFPRDMLRRLEILGRFEMDPVGSGIDANQVSQCVMPFYEDAKADPDGFLADLRVLSASDASGFARYGASRLVFELLGHEARTDDALAMLDAAIAFKRERGLPSIRLTGYELARWEEVHGPGTW
jgi:hypothetical protein